MARAREITVGWTAPVTEEEYRVRISVTPGNPGRTYGDPGDCYPAEGPEFEVVEVREDRVGGQLRPELIPVVEAELSGRWGDEVAEAAEDDARDRRVAYDEDRADAAREERMLGGRP